MNKFFPVVALLFFIFHSAAQSDQAKARELGLKAIKIMDQGEIDKSIELLEECEKLDPENYIYPYEIAFAHVKKEEYKKAIKILDKTKKYKNANSQVYQMSGNCYSYMGKPDKAIAEYEEGMKKFPNAGNLHLEKGNIFLQQEKYNEAVTNYIRGTEVDPMYSSNYYRLALVYLSSTDKLSGIIYGELFVNIERTTNRTIEISELLFETYKKSITFKDDGAETDFCDIIIDARSMPDPDNITLPLCGIFGKHFILATLGESEVTLASLANMREKFLNSFFEEDYKDYPNVLFEYQKDILDAGHFEAYSHYIFQMGASDEFETWKNNNEEKYSDFVAWYTKKKNVIDITTKNYFSAP